MYEKCFQVTMVAAICLVLFGVPASAAPISYQYIYDTVDGNGAAANQPPATGSPADLLHNPSYTTYSTGELNDGWSVPEGIWDAGASYTPSHNRYNFWDSNGGHQVCGQGVNDWNKAKPSIVAKFDSAYELDTITVNYEVMSASGIHAPGTPDIKAYFGVDDGLGGISWSSANDLPGWIDANPDSAYDAGYPYNPYFNASNIWVNTIDVTGMAGSDNARYVRLDVVSRGEWMSLIEIGFADSAPVPEPSTLALLSASLIGLLCYAWRKRK